MKQTPELAAALARIDALTPRRDFDGETLRLLLRLFAAINRGVMGAVADEAQALLDLWASTPGRGTDREGLTKAEVNGALNPNAPSRTGRAHVLVRSATEAVILDTWYRLPWRPN